MSSLLCSVRPVWTSNDRHTVLSLQKVKKLFFRISFSWGFLLILVLSISMTVGGGEAMYIDYPGGELIHIDYPGGKIL